MIKTRLEKIKSKWVEKLSNFLWVYWTTLQKTIKEMSYSLIFNFEVVIPLEVGCPTIRTKSNDDNHNAEVLTRDFDLADKKKGKSIVQMANYQK